MRDFPAIQRNTSDMGAGFMHVQNARYKIKGEMGRRLALVKQTPTSMGFALYGAGFGNGFDYAIGIDATTGNLTAVAV
jgi:hypothetical protein